MAQGHIQPTQKKRLIHRLKILQGQIRGLEKSVESEDYCLDVLNLSNAIQESLKSFDALMLENHLSTHVSKQFKGKKDSTAIKELMRIYKLNQK